MLDTVHPCDSAPIRYISPSETNTTGERHNPMLLFNSTHLDTARLRQMFESSILGWPHDPVLVRVRYSRSSAFSGTCFYTKDRIHINLGRRNTYPYAIVSHVAPAKSGDGYWSRDLYSVVVADPEQLVLFIFLHEFYHWLLRKARRNMRQKEGRCDRFATRVLVDRYATPVVDARGNPVPREMWDFQDLDSFVAAARRNHAAKSEPANPDRAARASPAQGPVQDCQSESSFQVRRAPRLGMAFCPATFSFQFSVFSFQQ